VSEPYEVLEEEFGKWANVQYPVACGSGTAALHLALETLGIKKGLKVLVPDFAMIAVARAVKVAGLEPVFVDCSSDLNMDLDALTRALGDIPPREVGGIVAVHTYGRKLNMEMVHDLARHYVSCPVIEDLAEAHGVSPHPLTAAACWSFYKNKIIYGEEGGLVAFGLPEFQHIARQLRSHGFTDSHDFWHLSGGWNHRLANSLATRILLCLPMADTYLAQRRQVERLYDDLCPDDWRMPGRDVVWVYDVRIPYLDWEEQARLIKACQKVGIEARHSFKPLSIQVEFSMNRCYLRSGEVHAAVAAGEHKALRMSQEVLYLPATPGTQGWVCKRAFDAMKKALGR
jgi:perosamine synthetase